MTTDASVYEELRERSPALARFWAITEFCRLVFATATFCGPWAVIVGLSFAAARQSLSDLVQLFASWQLYVLLVVVAVAPFAAWRVCERVTQRILRGLDDAE